MACLILSLTASLVMWFLNEMPSSVLKHLISVASNFFRMSAVNAHAGFAGVQQYLDNQGAHKSDL